MSTYNIATSCLSAGRNLRTCRGMDLAITEIERLQAELASIRAQAEGSTEYVLAQVNQELRAELAAMKAELTWLASFNEAAHDCLPGCDRIAHDELCPNTSPEFVMARIARKALKGDTER